MRIFLDIANNVFPHLPPEGLGHFEILKTTHPSRFLVLILAEGFILRGFSWLNGPICPFDFLIQGFPLFLSSLLTGAGCHHFHVIGRVPGVHTLDLEMAKPPGKEKVKRSEGKWRDIKI
jgi:hypothetical protein